VLRWKVIQEKIGNYSYVGTGVVGCPENPQWATKTLRKKIHKKVGKQKKEESEVTWSNDAKKRPLRLPVGKPERCELGNAISTRKEAAGDRQERKRKSLVTNKHGKGSRPREEKTWPRTQEGKKSLLGEKNWVVETEFKRFGGEQHNKCQKISSDQRGGKELKKKSEQCKKRVLPLHRHFVSRVGLNG